MRVKLLSLTKQNFDKLARIQSRVNDSSLAEIEKSVDEIIRQVKSSGDNALYEYNARFDNYTDKNLRLDLSANFSIDKDLEDALLLAKTRIESFHKAELLNSKLDTGWSYTGDLGEALGVKYDAIESVAVYVPGGKASLVSTVLMTVIPAKVAGVKRIVMVSPPSISDVLHYAAKLCGVDEVYQVGGAQAIAALAYGTETIKPVKKIVGPGNIYVSLAKKNVFGKVGIDGIYGPSEIAVLADSSADPDYIASDLLSQLEHGSGLESSLLVSLSETLVDQVKLALERQIDDLKPYKTSAQINIIKSSYENWTALLYEADLDSAISLINTYAPEHLELQLQADLLEPALREITNAGAIFIGNNSCESLGDYLAGPSHCLPTAGSAAFSSGLQVIDFITKTSLVNFSTVDRSSVKFSELTKSVAIIARAENLEAHARAMEYRTK
jgi:histidinol dehydrogenase